ncbi:histidine phosphatase family protein [Palleronia caenipelagi]|uniref:Histidine phosphatase family protein n=1 Tax=Palleronia caenipelagi TaxID=2489174 RepID=A0A547Q8H5_9RHOB|nr:histidine phosphatase family protein [Palleronia caenipelagi]TRD22685.1 histidine phosphatase family protein [Palleronia caenipelagi]
MPLPASLILIRHARITTPDRLAGRSDFAAEPDPTACAALAATLPPVAHVINSPAQRCRVTAEALFPGRALRSEPDIWEQDFGIWDGQPLADLPDLGPLTPEALAMHLWDRGESFADLCDRVTPALTRLAVAGETIAVVAHAGTIRAALSMALGGPGPALAFHIAPLSATQISLHPSGAAVGYVNRIAS